MLQKPEIIAGRERIRAFTEGLVLPSSPGARRDAIWDDLVRLDDLLECHGPATFELRSEIRTKASAIRKHLLGKARKDADDCYQYIHCVELLADVGTDSPIDIPALRRYASEVVAFYLHQDDRPRLARSILVYANTWRLAGYEKKARWYMRYAWHIQKEWCDARDPVVAHGRHNALVHEMRFFGNTWLPKAREKARDELLRLADIVGTPNVWLETHRELVNYWNMIGDYRRAMDEYMALEKLRQRHRFPEYGIPCLKRPKIHVLLQSQSPQDRQKAFEMIEQEYLKMYLADRHCYYWDVLLGWKRDYPELAFNLDPEKYGPEYGAVILTYLPRNKVDAA